MKKPIAAVAAFAVPAILFLSACGPAQTPESKAEPLPIVKTTPTSEPPVAIATGTVPKSTTVVPAPTMAALAHYANCAAARAAGAAPLHRGDPGYRAGLDRDKDGIACDS